MAEAHIVRHSAHSRVRSLSLSVIVTSLLVTPFILAQASSADIPSVPTTPAVNDAAPAELRHSSAVPQTQLPAAATSAHTSLTVNGEDIPLQPNDTVERVITDGTSSTAISVETQQTPATPDAGTANQMNIDVQNSAVGASTRTIERSQLRIHLHQTTSE